KQAITPARRVGRWRRGREHPLHGPAEPAYCRHARSEAITHDPKWHATAGMVVKWADAPLLPAPGRAHARLLRTARRAADCRALLRSFRPSRRASARQALPRALLARNGRAAPVEPASLLRLAAHSRHP